MILAWALAILLLAEGLAAGLLASVGARARLAADQRLLLEADLAVGSALARSRVEHDSLLARLAPGASVVLPPPSIEGWQVAARAARDPAAALVELEVTVRRGTPPGRDAVLRRGTLLLRIGPADTALVMDDRPRY